jgi:K+-transporting ATPase c subunit
MIQLTTQQKDLLIGQNFTDSSYFNPIQDINGNWFISKIEQQQSSVEWLKALSTSEYVPKPQTNPF